MNLLCIDIVRPQSYKSHLNFVVMGFMIVFGPLHCLVFRSILREHFLALVEGTQIRLFSYLFRRRPHSFNMRSLLKFTDFGNFEKVDESLILAVLTRNHP